ncbi:uncharacterized protein LOC119530521 [Choloepus didactylus]|uniref:uncharacterized protein LOC119530521 n=1 Tax=Choloepus didactylus TaxID=27675 RepID=UPI0018A06AC1|nr:uncharacterized protein LOC119530521 [Choloepus didactylus]
MGSLNGGRAAATGRVFEPVSSDASMEESGLGARKPCAAGRFRGATTYRSRPRSARDRSGSRLSARGHEPRPGTALAAGVHSAPAGAPRSGRSGGSAPKVVKSGRERQGWRAGILKPRVQALSAPRLRLRLLGRPGGLRWLGFSSLSHQEELEATSKPFEKQYLNPTTKYASVLPNMISFSWLPSIICIFCLSRIGTIQDFPWWNAFLMDSPSHLSPLVLGTGLPWYSD